LELVSQGEEGLPQINEDESVAFICGPAPGLYILRPMTTGHGYKATYDYVELTVEKHEEHWHVTLRDSRHGEEAVDDEEYETAAEAKDAALSLAENHISIQHNDTLLARAVLTWHEF
jgi:hypothetical protein